MTGRSGWPRLQQWAETIHDGRQRGLFETLVAVVADRPLSHCSLVGVGLEVERVGRRWMG